MNTIDHAPRLADRRYAGLDGLRAVAVLLVIAFHLLPFGVAGGYLGVDVFFVISGFLITALLLRERAKTGSIRLGTFWMRRVRRLVPALVLLMLVCCAAALALGGDRLLHLGRQVLGAITFSSNWLSLGAGASYYDASAPELFRNLWSLAVEEQFYLIWPIVVLLIALIPLRWLRVVLLVAVAIASATAMAMLYRPDIDPTRVYYGTDTHSFGLALGAALAMLARDWPPTLLSWPRVPRVVLPVLGWVALTALLVLAVGMVDNAAFPYQGGLALTAVLSAIVIAGAVVPGSSLGASLDIQPLRWIGERSYGLYLWHWPVWILLSDGLKSAEPTWLRSPWMIGGIAAALTFGAAAISYRFLEQPIRRQGFRAVFASWASPWRRGVRGVLATATTIALVFGLGTASALAMAADPGKTELEQQLAAAQARIDSAAAARPVKPMEEPPRPATGDRIFAVGDSVMLAAAPQLHEQFPGILIDATVSRSMFVAPELVQSIVSSGAMRDVLVLGLGTNGPIDEESLEAVRKIVGADVEIVLVNVQAPRDWTSGVNAELASYAQRYRQVELANWQGAIAPNVGELAPDEIHPGGPLTGGVYCDAIRDALQRLAELPPIRTDDDYGDLNRPV